MIHKSLKDTIAIIELIWQIKYQKCIDGKPKVYFMKSMCLIQYIIIVSEIFNDYPVDLF